MRSPTSSPTAMTPRGGAVPPPGCCCARVPTSPTTTASIAGSAPCPAPRRAGPRSLASRSPRVSRVRSEEHTSELQSRGHLVCRLLLEKKKQKQAIQQHGQLDRRSDNEKRKA